MLTEFLVFVQYCSWHFLGVGVVDVERRLRIPRLYGLILERKKIAQNSLIHAKKMNELKNENVNNMLMPIY